MTENTDQSKISIMEKFYKGSRKHILNLTARENFINELSNLIDLKKLKISESSFWQPNGHKQTEEARLDKDGWKFINNTTVWNKLASWWLIHRRGANTPNWDIVVSCELSGTPSLILVEAKAHTGEMSRHGKRPPSAFENSVKNHNRIGMAINEASAALNQIVSGVRISRDSHYQLANRVAFSWKLASMGIPIILVYLGIIGDSEVGSPFLDHDYWESEMRSYCKNVLPDDFFERDLFVGQSQMRMIIRSISVSDLIKNKTGY